MELLPSNSHIDFLSKGKYAAIFSLALICMAFYLWFAEHEGRYGIDFLGGHELVIQTGEPTTSDALRQALDEGGIKNSIVQAFQLGGQQLNEFSVRLGGGDSGAGEDSNAVSDAVLKALKAKLGENVTLLKSDYVGPTVGNELRSQALIAMIVGLLGILLYLAVRFEMSFAFGGVIALFHDVLVCMGIYLLAGFTITMGTVAAALTIVGYSVNDTIIIFDRVREEMRKRKNEPLREIMNESINATLSRTIITSLLTLFSALALLILGGGAISDLSLFLVVGIITGTYSTIYIASPAVLVWERFRKGK